MASAATSILAEQKGNFFVFEEKKEEEQETLATVNEVYKCMPKLMSQQALPEESLQSMLQMLSQVSEEKYVRTNWMVR